MWANRTLMKIITPAAFLFFYSFHHLSPNLPSPTIRILASDSLSTRAIGNEPASMIAFISSDSADKYADILPISGSSTDSLTMMLKPRSHDSSILKVGLIDAAFSALTCSSPAQYRHLRRVGGFMRPHAAHACISFALNAIFSVCKIGSKACGASGCFSAKSGINANWNLKDFITFNSKLLDRRKCERQTRDQR